MEDSTQYVAPDFPVERLKRFLGAKTKTTCPFCGTQQWSITITGHDQVCVIPSHEAQVAEDGDGFELRYLLPSSSVAIALVICANCGFVAPFSLSRIMELTRDL